MVELVGSSHTYRRKGERPIFFLWNIYLRRIRLAKFSKSRSNCRRILFLLIDLLTGINLRPREIKLICASVNVLFERFSIYYCLLVF